MAKKKEGFYYLEHGKQPWKDEPNMVSGTAKKKSVLVFFLPPWKTNAFICTLLDRKI